MKQLVLVRHGESEWNKLNLFTGWTDVDLSEKGVQEAKAAGELLKAEGFTFDVCYTSFLKRAIHTAHLIEDAMDLAWIDEVKTWRLNERHYGALQGLNKSETAEKYGEDQVTVWRRSYDVPPPALEPGDERDPSLCDRYRNTPPEGHPLTESLEITVARVIPYYEEVIKPEVEAGVRVMIVAHGNSLRGIVKELKGMSNEEIIKFNLPTAVPYVFTFDDRMNLVEDKFLGDPEVIAAKMQSVANQASKR